jgi:hypothetical protein
MNAFAQKLLLSIFVLFMIGCTPFGDAPEAQSDPLIGSDQAQAANDGSLQVTQSQRFSVEKRGAFTIDFSVDQVAQIRPMVTSKDQLEMVLISPKGKRFSANSVMGSRTAIYRESYQENFQYQPYSYWYTVRNPDAGEWRAEVKHTNSGEINFINEALSHILLDAHPLENRYEPGELATIVARLKNIDSQEYHQGVEIRGEARYADGNIGALLFYDDGTHGDSVAGDGQWTAQIQTPDEPTIVGVKVYAKKDLIHREADSIVSVGI